MRAWLYRELNANAKAWPYYRGLRDKQRQSIKEALRTIRGALATKDAHVLLGKGDNALHYVPLSTGGISYSAGTYSGFGGRTARMFQRLGIPLIDMRDADYAKLADVVIRGPMIACGREPDAPREDGTYGSLDYAPLLHVATSYYLAGAVVHNLPAGTQWGGER